MAPTLDLSLANQDLKAQVRDILLEQGGHSTGLLRYLYRTNPRVVRLLREVSCRWTTVHLRPGVMEDLDDPYVLPTGTKRPYLIRSISDAAGPYSGTSAFPVSRIEGAWSPKDIR